MRKVFNWKTILSFKLYGIRSLWMEVKILSFMTQHKSKIYIQYDYFHTYLSILTECLSRWKHFHVLHGEFSNSTYEHCNRDRRVWLQENAYGDRSMLWYPSLIYVLFHPCNLIENYGKSTFNIFTQIFTL